MDNNWAEVRSQLDQVLERERAQSQARRQHAALAHSLGRWWSAALCRAWQGRQSLINVVFSSEPQH
jgi:hypothetical protein